MKTRKDASFNPLDYPLCLAMPRRLTDIESWHEHVPFALASVALLKPRILVELGTHKGDSYCVFCQAVDTLGLPTRCYGVDHWKGDPQAGYYGPEVLQELRAHHDPLYGRFSELLQTTFHDALPHFADRSIDLLHIDGTHTYQAAKQDFKNWIPKMSSQGVVLLHDTNVRERQFGVWKLWSELKGHYPSFEFQHGHGLGVLIVGKKVNEAFLHFVSAASQSESTIGSFFHALGARVSLAHKLAAAQERSDQEDRALRERNGRIEKLESHSADRDAHLKNLEEQHRSLSATLSDRDAHLKNLEEQHRSLSATLSDRDAQVRSLSATVSDRDAQLEETQKSLAQRANRISELDSQLRHAAEEIALRDRRLNEEAERSRQLSGHLQEETRRSAALSKTVDSQKTSWDREALRARALERELFIARNSMGYLIGERAKPFLYAPGKIVRGLLLGTSGSRRQFLSSYLVKNSGTLLKSRLFWPACIAGTGVGLLAWGMLGANFSVSVAGVAAVGGGILWLDHRLRRGASPSLFLRWGRTRRSP